jgi:hypothetical protein
MGHCSKKCISSSISNLHSLQIRSFNGIFWCLPFSISKNSPNMCIDWASKVRLDKLPDVCQYEGKKKPSWDKTKTIFLSVWRQKKNNNQRTKLSIYMLETIESESTTRFKNRSSDRMMTSDWLIDVSDDRYTTTNYTL